MDIRDRLKPFIVQDDRIGVASFLGSFAVYFLSLYIAVTCAAVWPVMIAAGIVHAFASVRLYVLQHDCGHASLFRRRAWNDWAGYALSPFSLAPFAVMRRNHNLHHSHIGNLEARDTGEIHTLTVAEWQRAGWKERLMYRLYRNPFILIPLGALFTYFIRYRWPKGATRADAPGIVAHNLMILGWAGLLYMLAGWTGIAMWLGWGFVGGMIGVFMVYLQHNFEDTYWDRKPDLDPRVAALQGSSALDLGVLIDLGSANIAYHDIHHFNARIPSYNLRKCHRAIRDEFGLRTIGWSEALRAFALKLWDEEAERLVPFPKTGRRAGIVPAE